ncbi:hypothetical protein KDW77_gp54 [Mycobacterium phage Pinnie]|uniref:Uncharacterized protein n=1 Tax=Mycobacterium phage Pinnie TaxID=2517965 RepID=A0A482JC04_9CAUD|nr:hypothetical protein KDW77_gp54 [Mycobacterium phage Pinnie]QBP30268.1 hypothetical protein SEA_PINNIE_54 [Mycobacterium phage Pinnie]
MIEPDLSGRCPLCDAGLGGHFIDCPTALEAEQERKDEATRRLHAVTVVGCRCHVCTRRPEPVDLDQPKES